MVLDAGIGFGKTVEHNLQLLAGLREFYKFRAAIVAGRLAQIVHRQNCGGAETERLPGALACTALAAAAGVQMFRTHDVAATVQALRMTEAILAHRK